MGRRRGQGTVDLTLSQWTRLGRGRYPAIDRVDPIDQYSTREMIVVLGSLARPFKACSSMMKPNPTSSQPV